MKTPLGIPCLHAVLGLGYEWFLTDLHQESDPGDGEVGVGMLEGGGEGCSATQRPWQSPLGLRQASLLCIVHAVLWFTSQENLIIKLCNPSQKTETVCATLRLSATAEFIFAFNFWETPVSLLSYPMLLH